MALRRDLLRAISRSPRVRVVADNFMRHTAPGRTSLQGSQSGGRWGPPKTFAVLYLGRPLDSVIVEAYRHLVDPFPGMTAKMVQARVLVTARVDVSDVLDLTASTALNEIGLSASQLTSEVDDYGPCWEVARSAHQLGLKGILAPAATGLGETLALFVDHLEASEMPIPLGKTTWERLPHDPRQLRIVEDSG